MQYKKSKIDSSFSPVAQYRILFFDKRKGGLTFVTRHDYESVDYNFTSWVVMILARLQPSWLSRHRDPKMTPSSLNSLDVKKDLTVVCICICAIAQRGNSRKHLSSITPPLG